ILLYFFFQAEDGIRDRNVTGVQTCALPISDRRGEAHQSGSPGRRRPRRVHLGGARPAARRAAYRGGGSERDELRGDERDGNGPRSEERRVGKEGGSRGWSY